MRTLIYGLTVIFMMTMSSINNDRHLGLYGFQKVQLKNFLEENLHGKMSLWNLNVNSYV